MAKRDMEQGAGVESGLSHKGPIPKHSFTEKQKSKDGEQGVRNWPKGKEHTLGEGFKIK